MDDIHYARLFMLRMHAGPALASWILLEWYSGGCRGTAFLSGRDRSEEKICHQITLFVHRLLHQAHQKPSINHLQHCAGVFPFLERTAPRRATMTRLFE